MNRTDNMNFSGLKAFIDANRVEMIDLKFVDLKGSFRHVTVPVTSLSESILSDGVGFDGSSVGFKSVKSGDMCLIPDLSTMFIDPFWDQPTLSVLCNIVEADTREEFIGDPRSIAIRACRYLKDQGIAEQAIVQPEFEFNIFDSISYDVNPGKNSIEIISRESKHHTETTGNPFSGYWIPHQGGYHSAAPGDAFRNIRAEIVKILRDMNVKIKYHHHEVGSSGQQEIEMSQTELVQGCDHGMLLKYVVKNVVLNHGLTATFMPKPIAGEAGNGMHIHFRMVDRNNQPLFFDPDDDIGLSELAYLFIGGVIHHGPSLAAFTNPSTNSYRRLVKGFEAPTSLFFSLGSRKSCIRIPKYATQPDTKRFEIRSPDSTCNLYFAAAAILMAGIDGIQRGIHAGNREWGPYNEIENVPVRFRKRIASLPESLEEALRALERDHDYLKRGNVFTQTLIDGWQNSKFEREVVPVKNNPTPLEFELYYNC
ncbi:type I glutamate--ammonia ligase [bacterium]|nr:type I glutamate--ammonia ligase [candidate division CSSED10-310 bacterium]